MMNIKDVKDLIDLITGTEIVEVEVERNGVRIKVRRESAVHPPQHTFPVIAHVEPAPRATAVLAEAGEVAAAEEAPANVAVVRAPLVGRFYRAPAPDAAPFVEVGDRIRKGQVLCIIEAMKLMNQIESEHAGIVRAVLAEEGRPVEFGEPLFEIEKAE
jgi:acetyl-CoA carboxylase biotin carboxyl carrier protein